MRIRQTARPSDYCRKHQIWTLLFLGMCGMFLLGREWQLMWRYEAWQWTCFSAVVLLPFFHFVYKMLRLEETRISIPLMCLGIFACVCMDPLKYYWTGSRLQSPPGFPPPSPEAFANVGLLTSLFCLVVVFVACIPMRKQERIGVLDRIRGPRTGREAVVWCTAFFLIGIVPFILLGNATITDVLLRGRAGGFLQFETTSSASTNAHILVLANFFIVSGTMAMYALLVLPSGAGTKLILGLQALLSFVFISSGGGRTRTGFILVTIGILATIYAVRRKRKQLLIWAGLLLLIAVTTFVIQLRYRDTGWATIGEEYKDSQSGFANDLALELAVIVSMFPETHPFINEPSFLERLVRPIPETFWLFVTSPIPRALWSGKPIDESFGPYNHIRMGCDGLYSGSNITPTIMGRAYMKYGLVGVIEIGLLVGLLWRWVERIMVRHNTVNFPILIACSLAYYLLQSTRDLTPGWLYPTIFLIASGLATDALNRLLTGRKSRYPKRVSPRKLISTLPSDYMRRNKNMQWQAY